MYSDFYTRCVDVALASRESPLVHILANWANSLRLDGDEQNPDIRMPCILSPRISSFRFYKCSCQLPFPDADSVGFPAIIVLHIAPLGFFRRVERNLEEGDVDEIVASKAKPGCNVRTDLSCWRSGWNSLAKVKNANPNEGR